jgi:choline kinase
LLQHAVNGLHAAGVGEIVVIGGYLAERITVAGVVLDRNSEYAGTNVFHSFALARRHLQGETLVVSAYRVGVGNSVCMT